MKTLIDSNISVYSLTEKANTISIHKACKLEFCDKEAHARGYCRGHYIQKTAGKPLKPLRHSSRGKVFWSDTHKECSRCHKIQPYENFWKMKSGKPESKCKRCKTERKAELRGMH